MTGTLAVVGIGPGAPAHRTRAAQDAITSAEVVVGYRAYLDLCADLVRPEQKIVPGTMGAERERAVEAVALAAAGAHVALVSTGDAGIYGMASLALSVASELAPERRPAVTVVPGVTAASAAGAVLGAPLARDFAAITLSDLLAPWEQVEDRLRAVAATDLVLALYNPRSKGRPWQLGRALQVLREERSGDVPVGLVTDAGRDGEQVTVTRLSDVDQEPVGMRTILIVGSHRTERLGDWLVTARESQP